MNIINSKIFESILAPICIILVGWISKYVWDKYILIKPKLILKMGKPLYEQKTINYLNGHNLTWIYECTLKNHSKYDAYNIKIFEMKKENDTIISNRNELRMILNDNNHLSSKGDIKLEIKKSIHIKFEDFFDFTQEDNQILITPGLKIQNPEEKLMPEILNNFNLYISYENEKGKKMYTKFTKKNNNEKNNIKLTKLYLKNKIKVT